MTNVFLACQNSANETENSTFRILCVVIYSECNYCTLHPETCLTGKNDVGAELGTKESTISCLIVLPLKNCMNNVHNLIENYTAAVVRGTR